ncbi:hypothetical protein [Sphingomonas sp. IC081]|uniref:hypothetical protein n=1 Tax=Sphingomonas sp. IC081 TaxID=304378 RepID=UPI00115B2E20|nr:hypothetical protein [Sphingomonas sp. IC081]QDK34939.1 hypothetical protein DM450_19455 [Sphingomonas sp. IC081]
MKSYFPLAFLFFLAACDSPEGISILPTKGDVDAHMQLAAGLRDNVRFGYYETGHMAYVDASALSAMKRDLDGFYAGAVRP